MPNITLSVPKELKHKMDKFAEINWSAVAREAFEHKIQDFEFLKKFKIESSMTERDALILGRKVSKGLAKRYKEMV